MANIKGKTVWDYEMTFVRLQSLSLLFSLQFSLQAVFTKQCHASMVYAVVVCLSVCYKSVFYWNG